MRIGYLLVNGILIFVGYLAMTHTDLNSPDRFYSAVLPLVDMIYCIYLLLLMFIEVYKQTWR